MALSELLIAVLGRPQILGNAIGLLWVCHLQRYESNYICAIVYIINVDIEESRANYTPLCHSAIYMLGFGNFVIPHDVEFSIIKIN